MPSGAVPKALAGASQKRSSSRLPLVVSETSQRVEKVPGCLLLPRPRRRSASAVAREAADQGGHCRDRLGVVEALLAHQRALGREGDRAPDGGGDEDPPFFRHRPPRGQRVPDPGPVGGVRREHLPQDGRVRQVALRAVGHGIKERRRGITVALASWWERSGNPRTVGISLNWDGTVSRTNLTWEPPLPPLPRTPEEITEDAAEAAEFIASLLDDRRY